MSPSGAPLAPELGRVVGEALRDDIGREYEEYAGRYRRQNDRFRNGALRIASFLAERGGALETDIGENGEDDRLQRLAEISAFKLELPDVGREAVMSEGGDADDENDCDRNRLKAEADARRHANVAESQPKRQPGDDEIDDYGWRRDRNLQGRDQSLDEDRGGDGQRHCGEEIGRQQGPAGEEPVGRPERPRYVNEE